MVVVVAAAVFFVVAQTGDDLGGGAPLEGPSAADLGAEEKPEKPEKPAPEPPPPPKKKKSTTTPTTPAPPPPTTTPPPPKTPAAAPNPEALDKATKLHAEAEALLLDLSDDKGKKALQARLDACANNWIADNVYAADPELKALHKLVKVRAAVFAGRFDDADAAVKEARAAADAATASLEGAPARRLSAAVRFAAASVVEGRARQELFGTAACGSTLGLRRLASAEARQRKRVVEEVADRYSAIAAGPDRLWGRRAAFQIAALYDDVARAGLGAGNFRGLALPSPYAVDVKDTGALLDPVLSQWLGEIRRSYGQLLSAIDSRAPDAALAEKVRDKAAALAVVPLPTAEPLENPWHSDQHEGLLRVARRAERRNAAGRFVPVETKVGVAELVAQLKKPVGSVDNAFAAVGLAEIAPEKLSADDVKALLGAGEERVVVAGLVAAEKVVAGKGGADKAAALRDAVTAAYASSSEAEKKKPFSTLQAALYGKTERALLALQAIARADRTAADAIVADERLPAVERAWLIAELLDGRFAAKFDAWAWDKDDRTAALAVWGGYQARGKNASYLLRPGAEGLVGCVSKAAAPE